MYMVLMNQVQQQTNENTTLPSVPRGANSHLLYVLLDFSLSVKATTLIFISGCDSAILSAKKGTSGLIYSLVKSKYAF